MRIIRTKSNSSINILFIIASDKLVNNRFIEREHSKPNMRVFLMKRKVKELKAYKDSHET